MSRLYLITGFLGAGKTTFLRRFLPLFSGEKIRLIINEFGEAGVDGSLLKELSPVLEEISGGSVFCACRLDQFEKALSQCGRDETILVEASGLSDPTGVRRLFAKTIRFPHITYMGGICLVDAVRFPKVYATARSSVRQLAASDVVVLNKIDKASPEQLEKTRGLILGQRPDIPVVETSFGQIPQDFLEILAQSQQGDRENLPLVADLSSRKTTILLSPEISAYELTKFIEMFSDTVVAVTPDGLRPAYAIKSKDFVTDEVIADVRKDCGPNPDGLVDLSRLREGGWIHFVSRWVEWDGMVSFQYHKGDERHYALHDLQTRETRVSTAFSDDYLCEDNNLPLDMCYADEGGVLSVLHAYAIPYFLEHIVAKGRLKPDVDEREKLMRLTDGANPVLFYHACPKRPS